MNDWMPNLAARDKPHYLAIADAIADDIRSGRLAASDRLPPQRKLARCLDIDFTTVARGYVEAQKRGLIESHVGRGTFVRPPARRRHSPMARHPEIVDLSMNLPPEPDDPELLDRMQDGLEAVGRDLVSLLRYQGFGGVQVDKDAASNWLSRRTLVPPHERLFITPGAHPAILAILALLAKAGDTVLSEDLTYPGARSIAAQLGLNLIEALQMIDGERNADFRSRHHVDRGPVPVEDFENPPQESVRHQHSGGVNVDQRDFPLAGNGFHHVRAMNGFGDDTGPGGVGFSGVQDEHGDVALDGGNHRGRVQHFSPKVGKLRGFGE